MEVRMMSKEYEVLLGQYLQLLKENAKKDLVIEHQNEVIQRLETDLRAVINHQIITENGVI